MDSKSYRPKKRWEEVVPGIKVLHCVICGGYDCLNEDDVCVGCYYEALEDAYFSTIDLTDEDKKRIRGMFTATLYRSRVEGDWQKKDVDSIESVLKKFGGPVIFLSDDEIKEVQENRKKDLECIGGGG